MLSVMMYYVISLRLPLTWRAQVNQMDEKTSSGAGEWIIDGRLYRPSLCTPGVCPRIIHHCLALFILAPPPVANGQEGRSAYVPQGCVQG